MKKAVITIAGSPGSGKSSTAKAVASELGYKHFSSGDVFRKIAEERGVSVEAIALQEDVDAKVDAMLRDMYNTGEKFVVDSRLAWHWMPESFKVFLSLDPQTSAERVFANIEREGRVSEQAATVADMRASIERRFAIEQEKYARLYGVDPTDKSHYDLVIDTKHTDLATVAREVLDKYEAWRNA